MVPGRAGGASRRLPPDRERHRDGEVRPQPAPGIRPGATVQQEDRGVVRTGGVMKNRNPWLISALVYLVAALVASRLARAPSGLAHAVAAVLVGGAIVSSAALTPARVYSRRALVAAGLILAASMTLPLALVDDPAAWLRQ